jgi:hypothetical protein
MDGYGVFNPKTGVFTYVNNNCSPGVETLAGNLAGFSWLDCDACAVGNCCLSL